MMLSAVTLEVIREDRCVRRHTLSVTMSKSISALWCMAATLSIAQAAPPAGGALYSGGDGNSCEQAVIVNTEDPRKGVAAEYQWLNERHPGGKRGRQAVARDAAGRVFDRIEWIRADGTSVAVCFDVTRFFGKP